MDEQQRKLAKQWIDNWKQVGPILERERFLNLGKRSLEESIDLFDDVFDFFTPKKPSPITSGLVEMQTYFKRAKR